MLLAKTVMHLAVNNVLQKMLPCKVALSVVLSKSMMMVNLDATCVGAEVSPEVVVAYRCKLNKVTCEWFVFL